MGVASYLTELRIRRLKWLQAVCKHPSTHVQVMASVFGEVGGHRVVDEGGHLCDDANPWAKQWWQDLLSMHVFEEGQALLEQQDFNLLRILTDGAEDFCRVDRRQLR
eukprot:4065710-Pyramimonas_sp.AAC.1